MTGNIDSHVKGMSKKENISQINIKQQPKIQLIMNLKKSVLIVLLL